MDSYIREKCIQTNCFPSLYVDESMLETLRHILYEINIKIIKFDEVFVTTDDQADLKVQLVTELVHIKSCDLRTIKAVCDTLSRMKLNFARPWHQSWFQNKPKSDVTLEGMDIFDLISLQIDDHRLYPTTTDLIESKLDRASQKFDLNKYLFDNNRTTVQEEILLHLLYHYGRHHYKEIIWLNDFRGTEFFDACLSEMNLKIINLRYVELSLDDYDDIDELLNRLWVSKHEFMIKIGTKFSTTIFRKLFACHFVRKIYLDVGLNTDYSALDDCYKLGGDEFAGRSDDRKCLIIQSGAESSGAENFIAYFERFCNCTRQLRYFYLILDGVRLDNWNLLNGLNLSEISFKRFEFSVEHLLELAACTNLSTSLKFIDCHNFGDEMLLKFLESCNWIEALSITGRSAITDDFFRQYARDQIVRRKRNYLDFRKEKLTIEVEGFEQYTTSGIFSKDGFIEDN